MQNDAISILWQRGGCGFLTNNRRSLITDCIRRSSAETETQKAKIKSAFVGGGIVNMSGLCWPSGITDLQLATSACNSLNFKVSQKLYESWVIIASKHAPKLFGVAIICVCLIRKLGSLPEHCNQRERKRNRRSGSQAGNTAFVTMFGMN